MKRLLTFLGLTRPAPPLEAALAGGLCSREGEAAFARFQERLAAHAPPLAAALRAAAQAPDFAQQDAAITAFLSATLDEHIVDRDFPACRNGSCFKNSFAPVRVLLSLAESPVHGLAPQVFAQRLTAQKPDNPLYWIAQARILLAGGRVREAADAALEGNRLLAYDACIGRALTDTQRALAEHGLKPDMFVPAHDFKDLFCDQPFRFSRFLFSSKGLPALATSHCTCGAWTPIAFENDLSWNSEDLQLLRRSILDGSYKYCLEAHCVHLRDRTLPGKEDVTDPYYRDIIDNDRVVLPRGPLHIELSYDMSCNLSCPSCRKEVFMHPNDVVESLDAAFQEVILPQLANAAELTLSFTGEALASKHSLRLIKSLTPEKFPHLKVTVASNLSTLTPEKWQSLGPSAQCIKSLFISLDGASKATAEKLRRGLKWEQAVKALEFIRDLRQSGRLEHIFLSFMLQKDNYQELPEILDLASRYGIDAMQIAPLISHGSYTQDEFLEVNACDPRHRLFPEVEKAIAQLKKMHDAMLLNRAALEAAGRSVPDVRWRMKPEEYEG